MKHKDTLLAAARIIEERGNEYGDMVETHRRIARLFNDMVSDVKIEPHHVATLHMATKLARLYSNPTHADSFVDLEAYTAFRSELVGEAAGDKSPYADMVARRRATNAGTTAIANALETAEI